MPHPGVRWGQTSLAVSRKRGHRAQIALVSRCFSESWFSKGGGTGRSACSSKSLGLPDAHLLIFALDLAIPITFGFPTVSLTFITSFHQIGPDHTRPLVRSQFESYFGISAGLLAY